LLQTTLTELAALLLWPPEDACDELFVEETALAADEDRGALEDACDELFVEETALAADEDRGALEDAGALDDRAEEERAEDEAHGHVRVNETLKSSMPLMGSATTLIVCEPASTVCGPQFQDPLQYWVNLVCHVLGETVK